MSIVIDSLDITGMKKSDFEQLEEIFLHFKESGIYWGRADYFEQRMARLEQWLDMANEVLGESDVRIKEHTK